MPRGQGGRAPSRVYTWTDVNLQPQGSPPPPRSREGRGTHPLRAWPLRRRRRTGVSSWKVHTGALTSGAQGGRAGSRGGQGPQEAHFGDSEGWVDLWVWLSHHPWPVMGLPGAAAGPPRPQPSRQQQWKAEAHRPSPLRCWPGRGGPDVQPLGSGQLVARPQHTQPLSLLSCRPWADDVTDSQWESILAECLLGVIHHWIPLPGGRRGLPSGSCSGQGW